MRVGGHDHPACRDVEGGLVVALGEAGVVEMATEELADQFGRRPAARCHASFRPRLPQIRVRLREAGA